ncbi:MAG: hypothetical protein ABDH91_04315 [Bacteroidia bacterium]
MAQKWHFLLSAPLEASQRAALAEALRAHLADWRAHGRPVSYTLAFPYGWFIEVAVEDPLTGCAIDALFRRVQSATAVVGLSLCSSEWVLVVDGDNTFIEKFYEIVKKYRLGQWPPERKVVEVRPEGLRCCALEASYLAIHLR